MVYSFIASGMTVAFALHRNRTRALDHLIDTAGGPDRNRLYLSRDGQYLIDNTGAGNGTLCVFDNEQRVREFVAGHPAGLRGRLEQAFSSVVASA